jgi:hypothetical protein
MQAVVVDLETTIVELVVLEVSAVVVLVEMPADQSMEWTDPPILVVAVEVVEDQATDLMVGQA